MDSETRAILFAGMSFVAGLMLGMGAGVLLAPQSGEKTRRWVRETVSDAVEDTSQHVGQWMEDAKDTMSDLAQQGKKFVS